MRSPYRRNTPLLVALLVAAAGYLVWHSFGHDSGASSVEGPLGVFFGLYVCSRPAANGIDLFFFERGGLRVAFSGWSGIEWLMLNALVMLAGWAVIVVGASQIR